MVNCDFEDKCTSRGYKCGTCARNQKQDYYVPRPWWNPWRYPDLRRRQRYIYGKRTSDQNDGFEDFYVSNNPNI